LKDKPFFSVIIPAHNSAEFIRNGLNSIKKQTFKDYELIVVCDSCRDNTAEIAMGYADKTLIREFGCDGLARNAGIEAAEGEWILFMDDDDWWIHEYVLHQLHHYAEHTDADLLPFQFIWPNDPCGRYYWDHAVYRMNIAVWSKAFRRELIGDTRFPDRKMDSDVPFMHAILDKNPKVYYIHELYYYYNYLRPGSQTEVHEREQMPMQGMP
jgi:glycosyltransferase involved in cell wall biosynthesis